MTDECIHGLELDRCDICSPKARPVPVASAPPARTRTPRPLSSGSSAPRRSSPAASQKKPIILSEQRIHHLTPLNNLTGILVEGALYADAAEAWSDRPEVDISSHDTREARRTTPIPGTGTSVADYVPFFLSPNANLWEGIRTRTPDPRVAPEARALPAAEFVMLVTTIKQLVADDEGYPVVADGDAADARTRFASTRDDAERSLRRIFGSDDGTVLRAELLVHESVPFERVTLIGVANDKARTAVRAALAGSGYQPRVAVHPPWFALPEM